MKLNLWAQSISSDLAVKLRRLFLGDAQAELSRSITDRLLIFNDSLFHLESGRNCALSDSSDSLEIADVAKQLLGEDSNSKNIELLLAPYEFVATSRAMPGVSSNNLESALLLQQETLLPAFDQPLALAVANERGLDKSDQVTALWMPQDRLQSLFRGFAEKGLKLVAVQPRVLGNAIDNAAENIIEEEGHFVTAVALENGVVTQWIQSDKKELDQTEFANQWNAEVAALTNPAHIDSENMEYYLNSGRASSNYLFFPQGALEARKRVEKGRQILIAASLVAGLMVMSSLPFIFQSIEFRMANSRLQATQQMSADARSDQSIVVNFENQWGAINDYPDQQLRQAMFRLQEVLDSEQLSSLELSEGLIRIQGTSADPQAILQSLEQDPMFTEVVFSRATNNTRYYIDLRLATVSFEAYMVRYFPDAS